MNSTFLSLRVMYDGQTTLSWHYMARGGNTLGGRHGHNNKI